MESVKWIMKKKKNFHVPTHRVNIVTVIFFLAGVESRGRLAGRLATRTLRVVIV